MKHWLLVLLVGIGLVGPINAEIVTQSFSWFDSGPGTSKFMVPAGWYTQAGEVKGNFRVTVSAAEPDENGEIGTGLVVDVLQHLPELTGRKPSQYAMTIISVLMNGKKVVQPAWQRDLGGVKEFGVQLQTVEQVFQYKLVANDETGTLFISTFQAPREGWDEAWKQGELMLEDMKLDMGI